ncbi:MAG: glycosyltransferase family 39 protein, partial [Candidatus Nealsonbacteria bacterium]
MFEKSSNFKFVVLIFLIAIISGFFWSFGNFGEPLASDEIHYGKAAINILEGHNFCYGRGELCIEPQPLYPLFLSGVFYIFGYNLDAVRFIQLILFAFISVLGFLLAKKLFNRQVGVYSGLLIGLFYPLAHYSGRLYRELFFTFLVVLFIYLLYQAYLSTKKTWFILSGITLGLIMLTNAVAYFLPLLIIFIFLIVYKKKLFSKKMLICFFFFFFSLIIVLSPWLIRNYYFTGGSADIQGGSILVGRAYLIDDLKGEYKEHFIGQSFGYFFAKKIDSQLDSRKLSTFPPEIVYRRVEDLSLLGYDQEEIG